MDLSEIEVHSLDQEELLDLVEVMTNTLGEYEDRIAELEDEALSRNDPEVVALRRSLAAMSDREVKSEPKSWVRAGIHAEEQMSRLWDSLKSTDELTIDEDSSTLEKYADIPENQRESLLGATDRRAVEIYENWNDIAESTGKGLALSTRRSSINKNAPSKIRTELNKILDEDLAWTQIYRAMKAVAELSGSELSTDDVGRSHLTGGDFEFHERSTPDNEETYKVLVRVNS
jgi:hypothetical protein